jgi:DNA-binding GntR family transcriptional regulator
LPEHAFQTLHPTLRHNRIRRAATIAAITKRRLDEMFNVMMELECLCAREAAAKMPPAERQELAAVHQQSAEFVKKEDLEHYYELNDIFHDLIY